KITTADFRGQTLALDAQALAGLAVRRDGQLDPAVQGGYGDLAAKGRFPRQQRYRDDQIVSLDIEQRMRHQADLQEQVAIRPLADAGCSLALEANHLAIRNTGRNLHLQ